MFLTNYDSGCTSSQLKICEQIVEYAIQAY